MEIGYVVIRARIVTFRLIGIAGLLMLSGCFGLDDTPPLAKVTGTVTLNGKPLANIGVTFFPSAGGPSASGRTDSSGKFVMMTVRPGDGAPLGKHKVVLGAAEEGTSEVAVRSQIPKKYELPNTSPLVADVVEGLDNIVDLQVQP